jgi:dTDP-L-rhamnose 4-epimerase
MRDQAPGRGRTLAFPRRMRILITGGAGFIGSHLADELLRRGHHVRVLDILSEQVHGGGARRPQYLDPEVELICGDVRSADAVQRALAGVDAVYHFAAAVGVGQSMYEVAAYVDVNNVGTAVLLEGLVAQPVQKLIVASSMSIYGEGLYRSGDGRIVDGMERDREQLKRGDWEVRDEEGLVLTPQPTLEHKVPALSSVYALSKFDQERLCLMLGGAYGVPTVALRFFNVFGPRQALSNPYTGVLAIFACRLLNGRAPMIFEDGLQQRDFVSVRDVVQACRLALEVDAAAGHAINVGSGHSYTVLDVAMRLGAALGKRIEPELCGKYRVGDIRHCFADISLARRLLGYEPCALLEDDIDDFAEWLEGEAAVDGVAEATAQLAARGLTV